MMHRLNARPLKKPHWAGGLTINVGKTTVLQRRPWHYLILCSGLLLFLTVLSGCIWPLSNNQSNKVVKHLPSPGLGSTGKQKYPTGRSGRLISANYFENDYTIGPEDVLDIRVFGSGEFNRMVRVSITGNITFPYLGTVRVGGLTVEDLEFTIAGLLEEEYLQNPQVSIFIEEFNSKKVTVVGEVAEGKAQVIKLRRNSTTIMNVLAEVGGLSDRAGKALYVIRPRPVQAEADASYYNGIPSQGPLASVSLRNHPYTHNFTTDDEMVMIQMQDVVTPINIDELFEYRNPMANVEIFPGDIVTVPRGQFFFIMGEVGSPGVHSLKDGVSVLQALSMGGKFLPAAKPSKIRLIRRELDGSTTFRKVNLNKIVKGEEDDFEVLPGDVFIVGKSVAKALAIQTLGLVRASLNIFTGITVTDVARDR